MTHSRKKVLDMLAEGTINSVEAEGLLDQLNAGGTERHSDNGASASAAGNGVPTHLYIKTEPKGDALETEEPVDVRIPLVLARAGMKLGLLIPEILALSLENHGVGIDLNSLDQSNLEELVDSLSKSPMVIDTEQVNLRIYCK